MNKEALAKYDFCVSNDVSCSGLSVETRAYAATLFFLLVFNGVFVKKSNVDGIVVTSLAIVLLLS